MGDDDKTLVTQKDFKRYIRNSVIGFLILLFGVGYAVHGNSQTLSESKAKGSIVRGVLCKQSTEKDLKLFQFVAENPPDKGGFGALITPKLTHESLVNAARERQQLGYAPHPKACNPNITLKPTHLKKKLP